MGRSLASGADSIALLESLAECGADAGRLDLEWNSNFKASFLNKMLADSRRM